MLEVKSKTGRAKSIATVLKDKDVYCVNSAIKLGQYNVGRTGEILPIPLYMGFLITDRLPEILIPDLDLGNLDDACCNARESLY